MGECGESHGTGGFQTRPVLHNENAQGRFETCPYGGTGDGGNNLNMIMRRNPGMKP